MNNKSNVSTFVTLLLIIGVAFLLLQRSRNSNKAGAPLGFAPKTETTKPSTTSPDSSVPVAILSPGPSESVNSLDTETIIPAPTASTWVTQEDPRLIELRGGCNKGDLDSCENLGNYRRDTDTVDAANAYRKVCERRQFESDSCRKLGALLGQADIHRAREECFSGNARSCMVAAGGLAKVGRKSDALGLLAAACGKGDPSNCLYLGDQLDNPTDRESYAQSCQKGEGHSCLVAGAALSRAGEAIRAAEVMKHGCDSGNKAACLLYGYGITDREFVGVHEKKCMSGDAQACSFLNGVKRDLDSIDTRCANGEDLACMQKAYVVSRDKPDEGARIVKALCSKGVALACEALRGGPEGAR